MFFAVLLAHALAGEVLVLRPLVSDPASRPGIDSCSRLSASFAIAGLIAWRSAPTAAAAC